MPEELRIREQFPHAHPPADADVGCTRIDFHTHFFPDNLPSDVTNDKRVAHLKECNGCTTLQPLGRPVDRNYFDIDWRIDDMDFFGTQMQVISPTPVHMLYDAEPELALAVAQYINNYAAKVRNEHPDRFAAFGTIPLQDPKKAIVELHRMKYELGLEGVMIGTQVTIDRKDRSKEIPLNSKKLHEVWKTIEELDMPIFVHPWYMWSQDEKDAPEHDEYGFWDAWLNEMKARTASTIFRMIAGKTFDKFPKIRWVFAHGGGSFKDNMSRAEHGFLAREDKNPHNVRLVDALGKFYVDSHTEDRQDLEKTIVRFGEDNVVMGSDHPFPLGEMPSKNLPNLYPGRKIDNLWVPQETKKKILETNSLRLLGWTQEYYQQRINGEIQF